MKFNILGLAWQVQKDFMGEKVMFEFVCKFSFDI
jgi:hypothetical protein